MQIQREKFLALTATLAGFWSGAGCSLVINDGTSATQGTTGGSATATSTGSGTGTSTGTGTGPATSTGSTSASATSGTNAGPTTGPTSGSTGGPPQLDCCLVNSYPGCLDDMVEACVCAEDPYCCGMGGGVWDLTCINQVNALGCGFCDTSTSGSGSSTFG